MSHIEWSSGCRSYFMVLSPLNRLRLVIATDESMIA